MISDELREVERKIDNHYCTLALIRNRTFGEAALHYLKVNEQHIMSSLLSSEEMSNSDFSAVGDHIVNRSKPALQWILKSCAWTENDNLSFVYEVFAEALELAHLADIYLNVESAFTYGTDGLVDLELIDQHIRTSGAMRNDAIYDAYDRIHDFKEKTFVGISEPHFIETLRGTLRIVGESFTYTFSPKLVKETIDCFSAELDRR